MTHLRYQKAVGKQIPVESQISVTKPRPGVEKRNSKDGSESEGYEVQESLHIVPVSRPHCEGTRIPQIVDGRNRPKETGSDYFPLKISPSEAK